MDYNKGEIFNKKGLTFKDGEKDKNPHGHPVVVLNDTCRDAKVYFAKMISDITKIAQYPGRYKLIKNTKRNGLERPSLICVDEIYCIDEEREYVRGEITLTEYQEVVKQICNYNSIISNQDEVYICWREAIGDLNAYLSKVAYSW